MGDYQVVRAYTDGTSYGENAPSLAAALNACAIYVEQPDIQIVEIWKINWNGGEADSIMNWKKG